MFKAERLKRERQAEIQKHTGHASRLEAEQRKTRRELDELMSKRSEVFVRAELSGNDSEKKELKTKMAELQEFAEDADITLEALRKKIKEVEYRDSSTIEQLQALETRYKQLLSCIERGAKHKPAYEKAVAEVGESGADNKFDAHVSFIKQLPQTIKEARQLAETLEDQEGFSAFLKELGVEEVQ